MFLTKINNMLLIMCATLFLASCGGDDDDDNNSPSRSIYEVVQASDIHTTLAAAIDAAGLDSTLDGADASLTLFAPTDNAFDALGTDTINALLADTDALSDILLYHVVGSEQSASDLLDSTENSLVMVNDAIAALGFEGDDLYLNYALVIEADLAATNGVVHVIDTVLIPPELTPSVDNIVETAVADGRFTTLVTALQAAGLDATLADDTASFTVFAPTDDAFAMLPAGTLTALLADSDALSDVLLQHVVADAEVDLITALTLDGTMVETASGAMVEIDVDFAAEILSVGGANVTMTDIVTSNGIIHVIDAVIIGDVDVPQPSIIEVAEEVGEFSTLLAALEATGLDAVLLDEDESYTVLAPTDAAFDALGTDTINMLLADTDTLTDILLYHAIGEATVLSDAAITIAASDDSTVTMANGDELGLSVVGSRLFVNTAEVVDADVMASNGVIHVLDQVLLPPADMGTPTANIVDTAVANGNFTTLVAALEAADLVSTLADENEMFTVFAPTDDAFALIPDQTLAALIDDVPALTQVLLQHVIPGAAVDSVTAFTLNGTSVDTASTEADGNVAIDIVDGVLQVQGAPVSVYDIYTTNGVIHVIDAVITETLN